MEAPSDQMLADRVRRVLTPITRAAGAPRVNVATCGLVVSLYGVVPSSAVAETLVAAAETVRGAARVESHLRPIVGKT